MLRVLVVDECNERGDGLRAALARAGHEVIATLRSPLELMSAIEDAHPDVIVIDTESPSRDVLEHRVVVSQDQPRPIVMLARDAGSEAIREAMRAGVSAYVAHGLDAAAIKPVIDIACAQFEEFQRLCAELANAHAQLAERKQIDRAKQLLMKAHGLNEEAAYARLRRAAMNRGRRLADVAQTVIDRAADLA